MQPTFPTLWSCVPRVCPVILNLCSLPSPLFLKCHLWICVSLLKSCILTQLPSTRSFLGTVVIIRLFPVNKNPSFSPCLHLYRIFYFILSFLLQAFCLKILPEGQGRTVCHSCPLVVERDLASK